MVAKFLLQQNFSCIIIARRYYNGDK